MNLVTSLISRESYFLPSFLGMRQTGASGDGILLSHITGASGTYISLCIYTSHNICNAKYNAGKIILRPLIFK